MSFKKCMIFLTAAALLLSALPGMAEENALYVRKVENLPEGFFLGMDVSSVLAEEASGVKYYDASGNERDLFAMLSENGVNLIRVRVWNDPFDSQGRGYGGGNCDIDAAVEIGKRAAAAGLPLLVDFHYSDFWADPGKQMAPKAWKGMDIDEEKVPAVEEYTRDCLQKLKDAGVSVAMVQLGNETNGMLCGEKIWMNIYKIMNAGSKAVREIYPDALIAVHFANPENGDAYRSWASKLAYYHLDYDVFGTSYYPYWHGTLDNLKTVLSEIADTYGKKVMVMETSYAWTAADGDFSGNSIGEGGVYDKPYPFSVQGQVNEFTDVAQAMADIGGIGVCYWEGAWVPVGTASWEENSAKWEQYGSGWAASYAWEYDPNDAGKYYGGSACDNQTLFDFSGKALPSLAMFNLLKTGQDAPLRVEALEEVTLYCDINGEIVLPDTVPAVMNDNSRQDVAVAWDQIDEPALKAAGVASYAIHGTADGRDAVLNLHMVKYNFIANGSFEDGDRSMWKTADHAGADELYAEEKKNDSKTGVWHWHFYAAKANKVDFDLEQEITGLPAGQYVYRVSVQGGDGGQTDIYSYVKINGETVFTQPSVITKWAEWHTPEISGINVQAGDTVTVGIHVKCDGAGAWGKIDDAELNSMGE
ncbi:MAG: glycosyl hydrolase 53 family protein [Clostridia bacterium]|nr:glycosyl hydrolase 53 family protein [Clostridia bacterium]